MTLIRRDTKAAIIGIFSQVFSSIKNFVLTFIASTDHQQSKVHNGEEIVRERALRLVHTKLKTNTSDLLNKEAQAQVITEVCFLDLIYKISPAVDCGDQEGFRLRHRHWRRVPATDGDPQHDLLAQVHRRPGKLFRFIPWWASIWHFEFRRRWLRWWPPWLTLTWPRTLTMPGTNSSGFIWKTSQLYFSALRRWTDCCSVPLTPFHTSRHLWVFFMPLNISGPEKYWLLVKVPSTAFAEYLIIKVLPHYYMLSEIPGADTKYVSITFCSNWKFHHWLPRTALCKLTAEMCLHLGKLNNPGEAAENVFDRLIDYMPLVSSIPSISAGHGMASIIWWI